MYLLSVCLSVCVCPLATLLMRWDISLSMIFRSLITVDLNDILNVNGLIPHQLTSINNHLQMSGFYKCYKDVCDRQSLLF